MAEMATVAQAATTVKQPARELSRIMEILRAAEAGQGVSRAEVETLANASDRTAAGLAKRLLAHIVVQQARDAGVGLLARACADLRFAYPAVLNEAVQAALAMGNADTVFELWMRAAECAAERGDYIQALVYLQNAGGDDNRNGARQVSSPAGVRRMMTVYERVARETAELAGIKPAQRGQRRSPAGEKLRLALVVGQLVDGQHSPSRVMRGVFQHADRERFANHVVITEALAAYRQHQLQQFVSARSVERAPQLIAHARDALGMPVVWPQTQESFLHAAAELHQRFAQMQIDIAFYHGSIITPVDWLLCAWRAAPWQFDYGFGVPLHCPGLDYQWFHFPDTMEPLAEWCRERGVAYGATEAAGTDMSHLDAAVAYTRAELKIPASHVLVGTVGNHLPRRMSETFCRMLADVLRAFADATYLVVGPGDFVAQKAWFGADLCAGETPRVRFVGGSNEPARWTKAFDIYANEFPAGGGIAVCEAMAARKAVVGIVCDTTDLAQAVLKYVGRDLLTWPATPEAYAKRLATLLRDAGEREQLGTALRQRYETYHDGRRWTQEAYEHIWQTVQGALGGGV